MGIDRLGRPLAALRVSVTDRCNLRCTYCMPESRYAWLPNPELLRFEEVARVVDRFVALGVRKVRLTGGEPLLRHDLPVLVGMLAQKRIDELSATTNGVHLRALARPLREAGLHRLTVSLDTLSPARFRAISRRDQHARVIDGIDAAAEAGFTHLKLDTVLIRGVNDDEVASLLTFAGARNAELRFIEYMDVGGATRWTPSQVVPRSELLDRLTRLFGAAPLPVAERGSAPAERFRLADGQVFGIIASTTHPFCGACDRARLTADGQALTCLYAPRGLDLKALLRSGADDAAIEAAIADAWTARKDRAAEDRRRLLRLRGPFKSAAELAAEPDLEMHRRGG